MMWTNDAAGLQVCRPMDAPFLVNPAKTKFLHALQKHGSEVKGSTSISGLSHVEILWCIMI